ncbi:hypothetical protein [Spongiactinospora sp. 9N601]|uniref:hypothetical protein n=1 Tax=Spongiactinospora sp. 9N601 TaxID=3375149 RepID=UPI0037AA91F3
MDANSLLNLTISTSAVGISLVTAVFMYRQTREMTRQRRISNTIGGATALDSILRRLGDFEMTFFNHPHLRAYFYAGRPLPRRRAAKEQVRTLASILCDILCSGIHVYSTVDSANSLNEWKAFCTYILKNSPAVQECIQSHPD